MPMEFLLGSTEERILILYPLFKLNPLKQKKGSTFKSAGQMILKYLLKAFVRFEKLS